MLEDKGKPIVLIVDDIPDNILLINEILKEDYRIKFAKNGENALKIAKKIHPDIILLDIMMPIMDGYEACQRLKSDEKLKNIPILFLTARSSDKDEEKGFKLGAVDYIVKPISPPILKERVRTHLTLKRAIEALESKNKFLNEEIELRTKEILSLQESSIMALAALAEIRDNETGYHLHRTKYYIKVLAEQLAETDKYKGVLTPKNIKAIVLCSPLHDIGKVGIPDRILLKPGPLTMEEYEIVKKHPILGRDAIIYAENMIGSSRTFLGHAQDIIYSHHEKWDGTGYPEGLSGNDIPLSARMMAIVDAYDAITSHRVYKKAVSHDKAVSIILADSGKHFDPYIVNVFMKVQDKFKAICEKSETEGWLNSHEKKDSSNYKNK